MEKYSIITNKWGITTKLIDNRRLFVCTFVDQIYVLSGCSFNYSFCFDTKSSFWKKVAKTNDFREHIACTVLDEKM